MKNKIPTAEDFYRGGNTINNKSFFNIESYDEGGYLGIDENELFRMMVEFAKLHVKAALEAAAEQVKTKTFEIYISKSGEYEYTQYPDKDSILNAYPENLIK